MSTQSWSILQPNVSAQAGQLGPPQSVDVSPWFGIMSEQLAGAHAFETQSTLTQSAPLVHALPVPQGAHDAPPQSWSVSLPSFRPSPQVAATHRLAAQIPLVQSVICPQARPSTQAPHVPPQSTSVSLPSFTPSVQLGAAQAPSTQACPFVQDVAVHAGRPVGAAAFARSAGVLVRIRIRAASRVGRRRRRRCAIESSVARRVPARGVAAARDHRERRDRGERGQAESKAFHDGHDKTNGRSAASPNASAGRACRRYLRRPA